MKAHCLIFLALLTALSVLSQTGNDVDHTIAKTWTEGGSLDMKTFLSGESMEVLQFINEDVLPYIRALQLDGNPVKAVDVYRNLDRPCLFMGEHTLAYLLRRPTTPSGTK